MSEGTEPDQAPREAARPAPTAHAAGADDAAKPERASLDPLQGTDRYRLSHPATQDGDR